MNCIIILDHDEVIGNPHQKIDNNLMNYVSNLRKIIEYSIKFKS